MRSANVTESMQFATPVDRLEAFFDTSQPHETYKDSQIDEVASLLERCGHAATRCPRTYIILRRIGELDLLPRLLHEGFDDQWLPVEPQGLPQFLNPIVKARIIQAQRLVLTKSLDLEKGRHRHFMDGEPLPFEILGRLGSGGYGQVDRIESRISHRQYALKRIRRRAAFGNNSKEAMRRFLSEIQIMRTLKHLHVIEYVGSYTDKTYLGLIMSPVADTDLAAFLDQTAAYVEAASIKSAGFSTHRLHEQALVTEKCATLRTYFGCLAASLAYLHDHSIRHKDIKPQNILVNKSNILLADFGLSREFADDVGSTTSGPAATTPRYCPPEVVAYEARNTSADIWSLGCVFFEMCAALHGRNVEWIKGYFSNNCTGSCHFHANHEAAARLISEWEGAWNSQEKRPLGWIKDMLRVPRLKRPTAASILETITRDDNPDSAPTTYCGICCVPDDETDSEDSLADESILFFADARQHTPSTGPDEEVVIAQTQHVPQEGESLEIDASTLKETDVITSVSGPNFPKNPVSILSKEAAHDHQRVPNIDERVTPLAMPWTLKGAKFAFDHKAEDQITTKPSAQSSQTHGIKNDHQSPFDVVEASRGGRLPDGQYQKAGGGETLLAESSKTGPTTSGAASENIEPMKSTYKSSKSSFFVDHVLNRRGAESTTKSPISSTVLEDVPVSILSTVVYEKDEGESRPTPLKDNDLIVSDECTTISGADSKPRVQEGGSYLSHDPGLRPFDKSDMHISNSDITPVSYQGEAIEISLNHLAVKPLPQTPIADSPSMPQGSAVQSDVHDPASQKSIPHDYSGLGIPEGKQRTFPSGRSKSKYESLRRIWKKNKSIPVRIRKWHISDPTPWRMSSSPTSEPVSKQGEVPIIVARCCAVLRFKGSINGPETLISGDDARVNRLIIEFSTWPHFGAMIDWERFKVDLSDIATIFHRYLFSLPDHLVSKEVADQMLNTSSDHNVCAYVSWYQTALSHPAPVHYAVAKLLLGMFTHYVCVWKLPIEYVVEIYYGVFFPPTEEEDLAERNVQKCALRFWIENHYDLWKMAEDADAETWDDDFQHLQASLAAAFWKVGWI